MWKLALGVSSYKHEESILEVTGGVYLTSRAVNTLFSQFLTESIEDKCSLSLPSGSTPRKQTNLALDVEFDRLHIGNFKCLSTGPARVSCSAIL